MIKSDSFVLIQGWMLTDLKLKGLDLMIFAIIYSCCQGESDSCFTGSNSYLSEWTNSSLRGVQKSLKKLIDLGLIRKEIRLVNGFERRFLDYSPIIVSVMRKGSV